MTEEVKKRPPKVHKKRMQMAVAHLVVRGEISTRTFPLSSREKYMSSLASDLRHFIREHELNVDLVKFRLDGPNGKPYIGWALWPATEEARLSCTDLIHEKSEYFFKERNRLEGKL